MKTIKMFLFAMLVLSGFATAYAAEPVRDATLVAKYFVGNKPVMYYLDGQVQGTKDDGSYFEDAVVASMKPNGEIIFLEFNGQSALSGSDNPVRSLPRPQNATVEEIRLWIQGVDENGSTVSYGYAHLQSPPDGSLIDFIMNVNYRAGTLAVPALPLGVPPKDTYVSINGYGSFEYDPQFGGYRVFYDETLSGQTYQVWHNGVVISSGAINNALNSWDTDPEQGMALRLTNPEGVEIVDYRENPYYEFATYKGLSMDGTTSLVSGESEQAKVFSIFRTPAQMGSSVYAYMEGLKSVKITVFVVGSNDNLVKVGETTPLFQEWGWIDFDLYAPGYQDLILVITEAVPTVYGGTFQVRFLGSGGK